MLSESEPRPYPSCAGASRRLLRRHPLARIEGESVHGGYDVVACAACGACFADGVPTQGRFDAYYREASKYEGALDGVPEYDLRRFAETADDLLAASPGPEIVELGCAFAPEAGDGSTPAAGVRAAIARLGLQNPVWTLDPRTTA